MIKVVKQNYEQLLEMLKTALIKIEEAKTDEDYSPEFNQHLEHALLLHKDRIASLIPELKKVLAYYTLLAEADSIVDSKIGCEETRNLKRALVEEIESYKVCNDTVESAIDSAEQFYIPFDSAAEQLNFSQKHLFALDEFNIALKQHGKSLCSSTLTEEEKWLVKDEDGLKVFIEKLYALENSIAFIKDAHELFLKRNPKSILVERYAKLIYNKELTKSEERSIRKAFIIAGLGDELEHKVIELENGIDREPLFPYGIVAPEAIYKVFNFLKAKKIISCDYTPFLWAFGGTEKQPEDFTIINFKCRMSLLKRIIQLFGGNRNQSAEFWDNSRELFTVNGRPVKSIGNKTDSLKEDEEILLKQIETALKGQ